MDTKRYYQIWTTQQSVGECIYHRRTEDSKYSPDTAHRRRKKEKHVNLLYVQDDNVGHFAWIKNLSRLVSLQLTKKSTENIFAINKYAINKSKVFIIKIKLNNKNNKNIICFVDVCTTSVWNEKLETHVVDCEEMNDCAIRLPSDDDKWLSFSKHSRREQVSFIIYDDLECILEKTDNDPRTSQHHRVFSLGYYVRCSHDEHVNGNMLYLF